MNLDIVSTADIAEMLQVRPNRVSVWLHRKQMPEPEAYVSNDQIPIWNTETIMTWAKATGKMPMTDFR